MKLGVLTNLLADVPFAEAAKYFASLGIQAVEIGCGGYPGKAHADPDVLLNDEKALNDFRDLLKKNDLMISVTATPFTRIRILQNLMTNSSEKRFCFAKKWASIR